MEKLLFRNQQPPCTNKLLRVEQTTLHYTIDPFPQTATTLSTEETLWLSVSFLSKKNNMLCHAVGPSYAFKMCSYFHQSGKSTKLKRMEVKVIATLRFFFLVSKIL